MRRLLALSLVLLASQGASLWGKTYLIIPLENVSRRADLDWIGESFAETIREALGAYNQLVVGRQARESAAHQLLIRPSGRLTQASVIQLGKKAGADLVIFGRFEFNPAGGGDPASDGTLRVHTESIDIGGTARGPAWSEDGPMSDLSRLQSHLAWQLLRFAVPALAPDEEEFFENHPPVRIDAIENYIRGLRAPELDQRHRFFTLAVDLEPEYSQPCFQLGRMQWEENSYRVAAQWLERVKPSDAHYMEANFLLGLCRYRTGNYAGALAGFELVTKSAPLVAAYNNLALTQFKEGIPDAAMESLLWVLQKEPADPDYHFNTGYLLWRQGDVDSAVERFEAVLALDPNDVDAKELLKRCRNGEGPRRGDLSGQGLERLKSHFEETSYRKIASKHR